MRVKSVCAALARPVLLRQHDLAIRRVVIGAPDSIHVAMQRAELAVLVTAGILLLQQLEQRLGLELRRRLQPGLELRPVLLERIRASASRAAASGPTAACRRRRTVLPRVAPSRRVRVWPFKPLP